MSAASLKMLIQSLIKLHAIRLDLAFLVVQIKKL